MAEDESGETVRASCKNLTWEVKNGAEEWINANSLVSYAGLDEDLNSQFYMAAYELYYTVRVKTTNSEGIEIKSNEYEIQGDDVVGHIQQAQKFDYNLNNSETTTTVTYKNEDLEFYDLELSISNATNEKGAPVSFASLVDPLTGNSKDKEGKVLLEGSAIRLYCCKDNGDIAETEPLDEGAPITDFVSGKFYRAPCYIKEIKDLSNGTIKLSAQTLFEWANNYYSVSSGKYEWIFALVQQPDADGQTYKYRLGFTKGDGNNPAIKEWLGEPFSFTKKI